MSDIESRVKKIVIDHLGIEESKVTKESKFIDDLGADSLDTVELVMAFEEEFGIEIPDDAAETILTVNDAIEFIFNSMASLDKSSEEEELYSDYEDQFQWFLGFALFFIFIDLALTQKKINFIRNNN